MCWGVPAAAIRVQAGSWIGRQVMSSGTEHAAGGSNAATLVAAVQAYLIGLQDDICGALERADGAHLAVRLP